MHHVHLAGPAPAGFQPTGLHVLRLHPCDGEPIDQRIEDFAWRHEPGDDDRLILQFHVLGIERQVRMSVESWNPFHSCGCLLTPSGRSRVELFAAGAQ